MVIEIPKLPVQAKILLTSAIKIFNETKAKLNFFPRPDQESSIT